MKSFLCRFISVQHYLNPRTLLFFLFIYSSSIQCQWINSGYTDGGVWTTSIGNGPSTVNVVPPNCVFANATGNTLNARVFRILPQALPNNSWQAKVDFMATAGGTIQRNFLGNLTIVGGVGHTLLGLTAGTLDPDLSDLSSNGGVQTNQDAMRIMWSCPINGAPNTWVLSVQCKDQNVWLDSQTNIVLALNTQYYISFERLTQASGRLSVFSDPNRTIHVAGSPFCFAVPATVVNLNTIQHGAALSGSSTRSCTGTLSNLSLVQTAPILVPAPTVVADNLQICAGNQAVLTAIAPGGDYSWYNDAAGLNAISVGAIFNSGALNANSSFFVESKVSCAISARTQVDINVLKAPILNISGTTVICNGESTQLTASDFEKNVFANEDFIYSVFLKIYNRIPNDEDLAFWTNFYITSNDKAALVNEMLNSQEYYTAIINNAYTLALGSAPSGTDLVSWITALTGGSTNEQLLQNLFSSDAFFAAAGSTNKGFVDRCYAKILGRVADSDYWLTQINSGFPKAALITEFLKSAEYNSAFVRNQYLKLLGRPADGGGENYWTSQLQNGLTQNNFIKSMLLGSEFLSNAAAASRYIWNAAPGLSSTKGEVVNVNPTVSTVYTVTKTNSLGCTVSKSITVNVRKASFTINTEICANSPVIVDGSNSLFEDQYNWTITESDQWWNTTWNPNTTWSQWYQGTSGVLDLSAASNFNFIPGKYYRIRLFVGSCVGNLMVDEKLIHIRPVANAGADKESCQNSNTAITLGIEGPQDPNCTYTWSPSSGIIQNNGSSIEVIAPKTNTLGVTYTLQMRDNIYGCVTTDDVYLKNFGIPSYTISSTPQLTLCDNNRTIQTTNLDNNSLVNGVQYLWSPSGETTSSIVISPENNATSIDYFGEKTSYAVVQPITNTVSVYNQCHTWQQSWTSDPFILATNDFPALYIPNSFTPNADGHNDQWVVSYNHEYPNMLPYNATSYDLTIINRWGEYIYTKVGSASVPNGLIDGEISWNGYGWVTSGWFWNRVTEYTVVEQGVYTYILTLGNCSQSKVYTGSITLIGGSYKTENLSTSNETQSSLNVEQNEPSFAARIFPNPTTGELTVYPFDAENGPTKLILLDVLGNTVYEEQSTNNASPLKLDISNQPSGVYMLQLESNGQVQATRIIKQ
ncbi:MAG: DUF4214 domain-containing protein [Bacteroidetes bacterium]|nr:DUF4214 domain-containing protein [Bacteroidota bacterium]